MRTLILGGGLAGLSCSYHLGHENCVVVERNSFLGGHAATHHRDGAFWDEGPHVSFTKNKYVHDLFTEGASCGLLEYPASVGNLYGASWIPHPAQSNLAAVPEPLARQCLDSFLLAVQQSSHSREASNYQEWLDHAFGLTFSRLFPAAYTRKYWTCDPVMLATDWVGSRVYRPDVETVVRGYEGVPKSGTHYITTFRYPMHGGFESFFDKIKAGVNAISGEVASINLGQRLVRLSSGDTYEYANLISSLPLDMFVALLEDVPASVRVSASMLRCTSLLLVNVLGLQEADNPYHWIYVYDENKYSTRITQTHKLSPGNTPIGVAGIQVEVYESAYRRFREGHDVIARKVVKEILATGLLTEVSSFHTQYIPYANVIFDHHRRQALEVVFAYLERFGLVREPGDLEPMTDWSICHRFKVLPTLALAGRFGQWKYYWTDDCILRGQQIGAARSGE